MVKANFKKLTSKPHAVIFTPAKEADIIATNDFLKENALSPIPDQYVELLNISNGYSYDGLEFFGTVSHFREEKAYTFPDIITINRHYTKYNFFKNKVILGRMAESLLTYEYGQDLYSLVDRVQLRPRIEVDSLKELLKSVYKLCR